MKALSVRQPWAWAILHGKDIENRKWHSSYTGPFLIHAGKALDKAGYLWLQNHRRLLDAELPQRQEFQMGGFVGVARIIDCVHFHTSPWFFGPFGFVLQDAQSIDFQLWPGQLRFFNVSGEIADKATALVR